MKQASLLSCIGFVLTLAACNWVFTRPSVECAPIAIDVWYGDVQDFGKLGQPQRWINILGRVSPSVGVSLQYSLNGSPLASVSLGPNDTRLARPGDFNLDLDAAALNIGRNTVVLVATDTLHHRITRTVTVRYHRGRIWPLPYSVDWRQTKAITDVVQVVDGLWKLEPDGVRTLEPYYDRVLSFGDLTWKDYTVTATVTFHGFSPPKEGPPTYGVSHAGLAARWFGHAQDEEQPHVKWYPLGAVAEFRLSEHLDRCTWRIFRDGDATTYPTIIEEKQGRQIELGVRYNLKLRVDSLPGHAARYRTKFWRDGEAEPLKWNLDTKEGGERIRSGGALLVAHNTDVTFGNFSAVPNIHEETNITYEQNFK
jgi:hypothetical protein